MSKGEISIIKLFSNKESFNSESFLNSKQIPNTWLYFVLIYINRIEKTIDYLKENQADDLLVKINTLEDKKIKFYEIIEFELTSNNKDYRL